MDFLPKEVVEITKTKNQIIMKTSNGIYGIVAGCISLMLGVTIVTAACQICANVPVQNYAEATLCLYDCEGVPRCVDGESEWACGYGTSNVRTLCYLSEGSGGSACGPFAVDVSPNCRISGYCSVYPPG